MKALDLVSRAMVVALRDYVERNGFPGVILGLSGGVDSALSAAVAVDALGPGKVWGVMFTGIVTDVGRVRSAEQRGDLRLVIETGYDLDSVDLGGSISCSGACLTVVDKGEDWFAVDVSAETISKTAGDRWVEGAKLNLERALRLGDELGGHIVTGHGQQLRA